MKFNSIKFFGIGLAAAGLLISTQSSHAVLYQSATTTVGGAPVNSTAEITISGTSVTVKLSDLLADPASVGSVLNGISFNLNGATGASGLTADGANTVNLQGASPVYGSISGATVASEFTLSNVGSQIILSSLGSTGPDYLIIGPAGYGSANGSLKNGPHNPFILETATFYFTLSGANSFSVNDISGLTFLFGTSTDSSTSRTNDIPVVPEPSTVIAGALLLVPLGVQAVRRLRNRK